MTTREQLQVLDGLSDSVSTLYLYPDFNGHDWPGIVEEYRVQVEAGLDTEAFYMLMGELVGELGDNHSYFQSPVAVAAERAALSGVNNYVGIGVLVDPLLDKGYGVILAVLPGSPAENEGLKAHDSVIAIDGLPVVENGIPHPGYFRGPECSAVVMTVRSPGQEPRDISIIRARVVAPLPIDARLVPTSDGSKIGYIFIPTFLDETIPDQVAKALSDFGPLDGLIIDNRVNGGGAGSVMQPILSYFTTGSVGQFISRANTRPLMINRQSINDSQNVPLVVLVGKDTESYAEIFSGVLQDMGRAKIVGEASAGNVETLHRVDLTDGSRLWLAEERFEPVNSKTGWEGRGVQPDVEAAAGWDAFTFETDPALAAALELLGHK
jgi:C-terminal peptidase prc